MTVGTCNSCGGGFDPHPWKPGWTDRYCDRCQEDSYRVMGPGFEASCRKEIAAAKLAAGYVEPEPEEEPLYVPPPPEPVIGHTSSGVVGCLFFLSLPLLIVNHWLGLCVIALTAAIAWVSATRERHRG